MIAIYEILQILLNVVWWIIIIQAILSWLVAFNVINTSNDFVRQVMYALDRMTEPMYRPIRRLLPDFGGLDFSPIVVLILLYILQSVVLPRLFLGLAY
jgi:YggT family protein